MSKNIRVLKGTKLLGKHRSYGEPITETEFNSIAPKVRQALINTGVLEVYDDAETGTSSLQRLEARIDRLQERIAIVESALGKGGIANTGAEETAAKEGAITMDAVKRGMTASFFDDDGNTVTGVIKSVSKRNGTVKINDGTYEWEVSPDELVTVE